MFFDGRVTLTADNVPQRLVNPGVAGANRITNITLQVPNDSNTVYVGGPTVVSTGATTGISLDPGQAESFSATDASDIWIAGPAGSVVRWRAKSL